VVYTTARTLAKFYQYTPLKIGLVLLSYGIGELFISVISLTSLNSIMLLGCIAGSVVGGHWSDYELNKIIVANGGKQDPEVRLQVLYAQWVFMNLLRCAWEAQFLVLSFSHPLWLHMDGSVRNMSMLLPFVFSSPWQASFQCKAFKILC